MKAKIADVVFRAKEVELPDTCPHCGHDLTARDGLVVCAFDYTYFCCDNRCKPFYEDEEGEHFETEHKLPLGLFCANCSEAVVTGQEKIIESHDLVKAVEDTVWSKAIGRVILNEGEPTHDPS